MSSTANEKDNSCNKDDEKHITCTDDMNNMHITCTEEVDVCACCGKEGSDLNICNKCQMVKYCNAACKKKHRSKHKKSVRGVPLKFRPNYTRSNFLYSLH